MIKSKSSPALLGRQSTSIIKSKSSSPLLNRQSTGRIRSTSSSSLVGSGNWVLNPLPPPHTQTTAYKRPRPGIINTCPSTESFSSMLSLSMPNSPTPSRHNFKQIVGGVTVIFFDFDGTLTATPGDQAARRQKRVELCNRAPMLRSQLHALYKAGVLMGIISKSTETTICNALEAAGLAGLFDAPVLGKAIGFDGKAGFIEDMARKGTLCSPKHRFCRPAGTHQVLLVDDDVFELERARARGIQVYAAPEEGGLQMEDFGVILGGVGLPTHACPPVCHNLNGIPPFLYTPEKKKFRNLIFFSGECFEG